MGRQEKQAKATKAGAAKAEKIIRSTTKKIIEKELISDEPSVQQLAASTRARAKEDSRLAAEAKAEASKAEYLEKNKDDIKAERRGKITSEDVALGEEVKRLRDGGMAWWQIGQTLELPGFGDSAVTGKKGAGRARAIYKKAFGEVPRSQAVRGTGKASREKNETVKELKKVNKEDRKASVKAGVHVLGEDMTDEEIIAAVQGRVIGWTSDLHDIDGEGHHYVEHEEAVHPTVPVTVEWTKGLTAERCIVFRIQDRRAPVKVRGIPGATRTVRVSRIHTVR